MEGRALLSSGIIQLTTAGAQPIGEAPPTIVVAHDLAYFDYNDGSHGSELWVSDGSTRGTRLVVDLTPGRGGSQVRPLAALSRNRVLMLATKGDGVESLWVSDGTARGTVRLRDAVGFGEIVSVGNLAFYTARPARVPVGEHPLGNAIFRTDGTPAGTVEVTRIPPGRGGLWAKSLATWGHYLIFNNQSSVGNGVWRSDGTAAGTVQLIPESERARTDGSHSYTPFRRVLYFASPSGLWRTDGTSEGTLLVKRLAEMSFGMAVGADGMLYFFAPRDGRAGGAPALWRSDGTRHGTRPLPDLGIGNRAPFRLLRAGDWLYFRTLDTAGEGARLRLWRTDGSARGTVLLDDSRDIALHAPAVSYAGFLIYAAGSRLMMTNGTGTGTTRISGAPAPLAPAVTPHEIAQLKGTLLYMGRSSGSLYLWRVTPPGTISGVVYVDANGDGRVRADERRLPGFRVFLDANRNRRFDPDEIWSRTNARGEYVLYGVEAGTHQVGVTPVAGWIATSRPFKSVPVHPGDSMRVHFGQKAI